MIQNLISERAKATATRYDNACKGHSFRLVSSVLFGSTACERAWTPPARARISFPDVLSKKIKIFHYTHYGIAREKSNKPTKRLSIKLLTMPLTASTCGWLHDEKVVDFSDGFLDCLNVSVCSSSFFYCDAHVSFHY